jgi:hypothetical protein
MDRILFGDTFVELVRYFFPIDLYNLSLLCKKYRRAINKKIINNSMIAEIKNRMRLSLGKDHDEFMDMLKPMEPVIVGSFVVQCAHGEIWQSSKIKIYISKPSLGLTNFDDMFKQNNFTHRFFNNVCEQIDFAKEDKFIKFVSTKRCKITKGNIYRYGGQQCIHVNRIRCYINNNKFDLLISNSNVNDFVHKFTENNIYKNMYNITTDELFLYRMDNVFSKCTNLVGRSNFTDHYHQMHGRGFKFYKFVDGYTSILTNDEIIQYYFRHSDIIKIKCIDDAYKKHMCANREFIIDNDKIYCMTRTNSYLANQVFAITDILSRYDEEDHVTTYSLYRHMRIKKCHSDRRCLIKLFYSESKHYHGIYITDEEKQYNSDEEDEDGAILILSG